MTQQRTKHSLWLDRVDQLIRIGLRRGEAITQGCIEVFGDDPTEEDFYVYDLHLALARRRA